MTKEQEIMQFLHTNVFDPILASPRASTSLKSGVKNTIARMERMDAREMVDYYWSMLRGTSPGTRFARELKQEGFTRFEDVIDEFRERFNERWLSSPDRPSRGQES